MPELPELPTLLRRIGVLLWLILTWLAMSSGRITIK